MERRLDERRFGELLEESDDLQSDAMRTARTDLNDYVEAAQEARYAAERDSSRWVPLAGVAAGAVGVAALASASPAYADTATDVMALQTAASLENLAVATYKTALTLPFIGGSSANGVVKAFAMKTQAQHTEHAAAFNAAAVRLGGKAQSNPDPKYAPVVAKAVPTIKGPADVVGLAITLEDVAAQTYIKNVSLVSTSELRQLFASVAGVESQHRAILLAVQALLKGGAPQLIALPPNAAKLPAAAGSVGFPDAFYPTRMASPVTEGAVK
ncbi:MAG TPA: ferritin-like domain-containing protein [Mycobacteriales bacterium]|nr:ferritin-like domain-containing protein [Mycobacteriales bacterium]